MSVRRALQRGCALRMELWERAACWGTALSPPSPPGSHLINNVCEQRERAEEDRDGGRWRINRLCTLGSTEMEKRKGRQRKTSYFRIADVGFDSHNCMPALLFHIFSSLHYFLDHRKVCPWNSRLYTPTYIFIL